MGGLTSRAVSALTLYDNVGNSGKITYYASGAGWTDNTAPSGSAIFEDALYAQKNATNIEVLCFDYTLNARL